MATQAPNPAQPYSGLHPLTINGWALLEFDQNMNVQLAEFHKRFHSPRQHPLTRVDMPERPMRPKPR